MKRGRLTGSRIDPGDYDCPVLAAQLADTWLDYHHKAALKNSDGYAVAVRAFVKFAGPYLTGVGLDPADARLDDDRIDLTEVIYAWENDLLAQPPQDGGQPWQFARALLTLVHHRAERDAKVPDKLRKRAAAPASARKATSQPLDGGSPGFGEAADLGQGALRGWPGSARAWLEGASEPGLGRSPPRAEHR